MHGNDLFAIMIFLLLLNSIHQRGLASGLSDFQQEPFVDSLFEKAVSNLNKDISESIIIADSLRKLAVGQKDLKLEFHACSLLGEAFFYKHNYERSIEWFNRCLRIAILLKDKKLESRAYNSLGIAYTSWDYSKSLEYYSKSLIIKEQLGDSAGISSCLNNIGAIYDAHIHDYKQALKYYMRSWIIEQSGSDSEGMATSLLNVGDIHRKLGDFNKAQSFLLQCIHIADSAQLQMISELACESLFKLYEETKNWGKALIYHKRFSELYMNRIQASQKQQVAELEVKYKMEEQSNQIRLLKSEQSISDRERRNQQFIIYFLAIILSGGAVVSWILYGKTKRIREVNRLLEQNHLEIERHRQELIAQAGLLEKTNEELLKLSVVASKTDNMVVVAKADGEIEWVNEGFTRILGVDFNEFKSRYSGNLFEASLNPDIRSFVEKAFITKQSVNYSSKTINRQGREIWFQTTLTPIINDEGELTRIIAIDTDISRLKLTERELAFKQSELTDSIRYAQRIQVSMFPSSIVFSNLFTDHFIIFKPRDIVSGDFYWLMEKDGIICLAVADCTGHGVPGAFMGLIGISLLNEIFHKESGFPSNAAVVLTELRRMVKDILSSGTDKSEMHDGMDFSLCIIDRARGNLQFSGAYHSLFIARADRSSIEEIRGDKMPVGDYPTDKEFFTNVHIPIEEGDVIYLQSDGFWHQTGGSNEKKFGKKRYAQLLSEIRHLPLSQQKAVLLDTLKIWMDEPCKNWDIHPQLDDIMIVACRL